MKKLLVSILFMCIVLSACSSGEGSNNNNNNNNTSNKISFEAYIKEGETFQFEIDPKDCVSYDDLRNGEFKDTLTVDNFDKYFYVGDVYREHYEYDDNGNPTETYMKGNTISIALKDEYYYVDNWTRNGLEFKMHIVGEETRVMYNAGTTYDPVVDKIDEDRYYYGADAMIILSDFVNSWDEATVETYTGHLDKYELLEASGGLYLLDSSLISFKKYKDNIYYFAAYGAEDEYFIILIQTDDAKIAYDKEYDGIVYYTSGMRKDERYTGYDKINLWMMVIDLMKYVNE